MKTFLQFVEALQKPEDNVENTVNHIAVGMYSLDEENEQPYGEWWFADEESAISFAEKKYMEIDRRRFWLHIWDNEIDDEVAQLYLGKLFQKNKPVKTLSK